MELDVIYNMDCLEGMKGLPDNSVDMILSDLPYGTTRNKWDSILPLDLLWEQYKRILKRGGAVVLTSQMPFTIDLANSNREWLRYEWIWHKTTPTGFLNARRAPLRSHENILVFYEHKCVYNPQGIVKGLSKYPGGATSNYGEYMNKIIKARTNPNNYGDFNDGIRTGYTNYPRDVLTFKKDTIKHPTGKPASLFEYLIRTYTNEGDIVLDSCIGSGTTAISCIRSGRHYIGFELSAEYYNLAIDRIEEERHIMRMSSGGCCRRPGSIPGEGPDMLNRPSVRPSVRTMENGEEKS